MWANAQRDGRAAKYRWRPLFNASVWLTPTTRVPCSNAAKTRNPMKFAGVPQTPEPISVGRSSPYYEDMWRRYCCLTTYSPTKLCDGAQMANVLRFFGSYISSEPPAEHFRPAF